MLGMIENDLRASGISFAPGDIELSYPDDAVTA
jgi:hypothetical protein